tara:strand:+ start:3420 stop:4613 length:1194 start_codon:yes stop_codon:yes gene_type:complete
MNLKGKKLLILGAGMHQIPLIEQAKMMELEVHVCSKLGNYPGIPLAPYFHEVDISDKIKILELAKNLQIDGILTTATDVCLESMGIVVEELNLHGTGLEDSKACFDKGIMKKRFFDNKVPTANYIEINKLQDAIGFFNNTKFACVLKPTDSSGSRGVTKVENILNLEDAYNKALHFSKSSKVIIEEWLEGEELGAQAIVIEGKLAILILHSDITTPPPHRVPIGHGCPHPEETTLLPLASEITQKAIHALGIGNGICNVDFILSNQGLQIIEMTCRMGGTHLPEVCGEYWGINLYKLAIQLSLGENPILPQNPLGQINAAHSLIFQSEGTLIKLGKIDQELEWHFYFNEGENVKFNASNQAELGYVHVKGLEALTTLNSASKAANIFCNTTEIMEDL